MSEIPEIEGLRQQVASLKDEVTLLHLEVEALKTETNRIRKRLGTTQSGTGLQSIRDMRTERYSTC